MPIYHDTKKDRWVYEFDRLIDQEDGTKKRSRKRRLLPKGISEVQAKILGEKYEANSYTKAAIYDDDEEWISYVATMMQQQTSWIYSTLAKIKNRAKASSRACDIDASHIRNKLLESGGRCAVTGIKFDLSASDGKGKRPFYHSIDRIDSSKGYIPTNIRVVCLAANVAMLHWGEGVLSEIATGYVMRKYALGRAFL